MEKFSISAAPYYLILFITASVPLTISRKFFSVNNLPKSSAIIISGSILIILFLLIISYKLITLKKDSLKLYSAGKLDGSVVIFFAACVVSAIFSLKPSVSFWGQYERQAGLNIYIYLTAIFFIFGYFLAESNRVKIVLQLIEVVSVIISVYAILQFFKIELFSFESANSRPGSFLGNSIFLGGFLVLVLPFSALNASGKRNRMIIYIFPFLIFSGIVASGTRSAYLAFIFQLIIFFIFRYRFHAAASPVKKPIFKILIFLFVIAITVFLFIENQGMLLRRITDTFNFDNPRIILWIDAFNIFLKYPITGPGIAMFPAALEEFYSNALRFSEASVVYDHAHNNYFHALYTMGLIGFLAYLYMIYSAFRTAGNILNSNKGQEILSFAFVLMLCGYCIYGLTNFDDISILFFFFVFLSLLKSSAAKRKSLKIPISIKYAVYALSAVIIIFCIFNIKSTIKFLYADIYFNEANILYEKGEFVRAVDYNNKAINLNPGCSAYRFVEASQVYNYCFDNPGIGNVQKQMLLKQVETEINKAKENLYYINYCNGLLSLVYFEAGRTEEGELLMNEVLVKDSVNLNYRLKLARYLIRENRLDEANRSLKILLLMKPEDISTLMLAAVYYHESSDTASAVKYAEMILQADPNNIIAADILKKAK